MEFTTGVLEAGNILLKCDSTDSKLEGLLHSVCTTCNVLLLNYLSHFLIYLTFVSVFLLETHTWYSNFIAIHRKFMIFLLG